MKVINLLTLNLYFFKLLVKLKNLSKILMIQTTLNLIEDSQKYNCGNEPYYVAVQP